MIVVNTSQCICGLDCCFNTLKMHQEYRHNAESTRPVLFVFPFFYLNNRLRLRSQIAQCRLLGHELYRVILFDTLPIAIIIMNFGACNKWGNIVFHLNFQATEDLQTSIVSISGSRYNMRTSKFVCWRHCVIILSIIHITAFMQTHKQTLTPVFNIY